jgi:hypothetical protein
MPVSSSTSSAFPRTLSGSASRVSPSKRFHDGSLFRDCRFLYVQAPRFACLPDRSYRFDLPSQSSRGFYIRAEHASLPPHASDMLTIRFQAIDGVGTYTPPDSQPCRLLQIARAQSEVPHLANVMSRPIRIARSAVELRSAKSHNIFPSFRAIRAVVPALPGGAPMSRFHSEL